MRTNLQACCTTFCLLGQPTGHARLIELVTLGDLGAPPVSELTPQDTPLAGYGGDAEYAYLGQQTFRDLDGDIMDVPETDKPPYERGTSPSGRVCTRRVHACRGSDNEHMRGARGFHLCREATIESTCGLHDMQRWSGKRASRFSRPRGATSWRRSSRWNLHPTPTALALSWSAA